MVSSEPTATISPETRSAIDGEIARYPRKRGALLSALRRVQQEHGHISSEAASELAEIFELQPVDVMEVISFYNMFHDRPAGRHHVYVCTNLPCSLRGARGLLRKLEAHLDVEAGGTTADGRITLGHEECLGACGYAPMMRVDETYHEDLDEGRAKEILDALE